MTEQSVYKEVLLDHFHNPRNKGDLDHMQIVKRGSNPRCGDEIEIGINCKDDIVDSVRFRGRGCSICLASASIMSECCAGLENQQLRLLIEKMRNWFSHPEDNVAPSEKLAPLGSIRKYPARKKCVLLAWQALDEALDAVDVKQ